MPMSSEPGHPLFLPEDEDDEPVNVSEIQISRMENGQAVFYPRVFPATELQSLEQIVAELGGGSYILVARHEGRITTRRKYVLPGKPKPMYDESRQETPAQVAAVATAIDPMTLLMGGQGGGIMPLIMMMMQQQQQAADRQTQMFIAMMQNSRESSAEDKANARAEMQANIERERIASERMMTLMREALASKTGGNGGGEDFTRGVEFMRSFATQQIDALRATAKGEDTDMGSLLETLGMVMQGVGMLKQVQQGPLPEGTPGATEAVE